MREPSKLKRYQELVEELTRMVCAGLIVPEEAVEIGENTATARAIHRQKVLGCTGIPIRTDRS